MGSASTSNEQPYFIPKNCLLEEHLSSPKGSSHVPQHGVFQAHSTATSASLPLYKGTPCCQETPLPSPTTALAEIWALSDCSSARRCPGLTEQLHGLAFLWEEDEAAPSSEISLDCNRFKKQHNSSWAYDHLLSGTNFRRHNRAKTHSQDTNVTFYYKTWIPKDKRMRYILLRILLNMKAICKMEETLISFICWNLYWLLLKLRKIYVSCSKIYSITYYSRVTHQPSSRQENWIAPCCHQEAQPVSALWIFLASLDHK